MSYFDFSNIGIFEKVWIVIFVVGVVVVNVSWISLLFFDYKNSKRDFKTREDYKEYFDYKK